LAEYYLVSGEADARNSKSFTIIVLFSNEAKLIMQTFVLQTIYLILGLLKHDHAVCKVLTVKSRDTTGGVD